MYEPWETVDVNHNIVNLIKGRELRHDKTLAKNLQFSVTSLKRLGLEKELEGHEGCVNCLQWSSNGSILASGSDDMSVILWDPFRYKILKTIHTKHVGNIFSVKFLGDGSLIATGAADTRVIVQSIHSNTNCNNNSSSNNTGGRNDHGIHLNCGCHLNRVKRLAVDPNQPIVFWSASEDGLVIQYDLRESHRCTVKSTVFVDLSCTSEIKCIEVNPTKPQYIAVGCNDCFVRMYDRRMVRTTNYRSSHTFDTSKRLPPQEPQDPSCVQFYSCGNLIDGVKERLKPTATYVAFNAYGTEMLVNMGGHHIYLYDLNDPRAVNELRLPENLSKRPQKYAPNDCCLSPFKGKLGKRANGNSKADDEQEQQRHRHNYKIVYKKKKREPCACDYMNRADCLYKRRWTGDVYAAARDYLSAIQLWPDTDAYLGLINCLLDMKWKREAASWLNRLESLSKNDLDKTILDTLREQIEHCIDIKSEQPEDDQESLMAEVRGSRRRRKFERSGDREQGNDAAGGEDDDEDDDDDGAVRDQNSSSFSENDRYWREHCHDYELRFLGHCNTTTDIKEANFLGEDGNFICAGSDDGMFFVWDRKTTNVLTALIGDVSIVNCVQPHPSSCLLATSGIDQVVKLWSPLAENVENPNVVNDIWTAIKNNEDRMWMEPFQTRLANLNYGDNDGSYYYEIQTCRTS